MFFSSSQKPVKGFLFAKLYFEAKEYELAKRQAHDLFLWLTECYRPSREIILTLLFFFFYIPRHVSEYLKVQERDPKAHKFLGQLFEREGEINKAVGCYKVKGMWKVQNKDTFPDMVLLCFGSFSIWFLLSMYASDPKLFVMVRPVYERYSGLKNAVNFLFY